MSIVSPHQKIKEAAPPRVGDDVVTIAAPQHVLNGFANTPEVKTIISNTVDPFQISIWESADGFQVSGDKTAKIITQKIIEHIAHETTRAFHPITPEYVETATAEVLDKVLKRDLAFRLEGILATIRPMTVAQLAFVDDLLDNKCPLVFGVGPTGTGKTYLAIAAAISSLSQGLVKRVVITKPHEILQGEVVTPSVRAEKERDEQFNVYFDVLNDLIGHDEVTMLIDHNKLEISPLGLLRGRTFNDAYIVIDEAQNTNKRWMRLAVTRAGQRSRTVITGDPSQSQLRTGETSGLNHLLDMLQDKNIARVHTFQPNHIVRNDIVARIEQLYSMEDQSDFSELNFADGQQDGSVHY